LLEPRGAAFRTITSGNVSPAVSIATVSATFSVRIVSMFAAQ
jgi:hypothetical protein